MSRTKSLVVGLVTLSAVAAVAYAAFWDKNETGKVTETLSQDVSIPFPGITWLNRIASPETEFTWNGQTYSSAYEAVMKGKPLEDPCRNFNAWLNTILLSPAFIATLIETFGSLDTAHYVGCYLRNLIGGMLVYYVTALVFHYFCYVHPASRNTFEAQDRVRPNAATIWDQIKMAQSSLFIYVGLPVVDEWLVENGYTQVYFTIDAVGGFGPYILYTAFYFTLVEIGIYWMHRTLHTNKFLYKHVHVYHHKYNKPETLTPWASIAFHPLDGLLQACPYTLCLPLVPCHYLTHFIMLFFTAVWATYIHDAMDWNVDPIMGSKYHTVHHTHYIYNYGQIFTFCDRIWGTFKLPDGPTGVARTEGEQPRKLTSTGRMGNKSKQL